ncbi:hypothetical protein VCHA30O60_60047 [Vibrio chagasii]|nr:hypothetical protein VCHA36P164_120114 [Vibrio chagasii]CAH6991174.1 hypothetical protein VCHA30O60_60047 [Vibrio chagasii]CAH7041322.1 hypothetical protein VCHA40P242_10590 [Vibrio chagasii]
MMCLPTKGELMKLQFGVRRQVAEQSYLLLAGIIVNAHLKLLKFLLVLD